MTRTLALHHTLLSTSLKQITFSGLNRKKTNTNYSNKSYLTSLILLYLQEIHVAYFVNSFPEFLQLLSHTNAIPNPLPLTLQYISLLSSASFCVFSLILPTYNNLSTVNQKIVMANMYKEFNVYQYCFNEIIPFNSYNSVKFVLFSLFHGERNQVKSLRLSSPRLQGC